MSDLKAAAQQALRALEMLAQPTKTNSETPRYKAHKAAITALRDALAQQPQTACDIAEDGVCEVIDCCRNPAQQEQEPVAWQWLNTGHFRKKLPVTAEPGVWTPLYTAPPRREWQSLSEEESNELKITYHKMRPTQFEVDNGNGIALDIRIDPESLMEGPRCFEIEQDTDKINVTLACLRALVAAAEELEKQR